MPDLRHRPPGRIHHVAIVVKSLDEALPVYRDLIGLPLESIMDIASDRVRIAFLGVGPGLLGALEAGRGRRGSRTGAGAPP